jgi:hypothetical protein
MDSREKIWDLAYSLIDERDQERVCLFEGIKRYEVQVKDIVDAVEDLAAEIEQEIEKDRESKENAEPDAYDERRGHNLV